MNRVQASVLKWYALVVVLMTLIVPWRYRSQLGDHPADRALGYGLVFAPSQSHGNTSVDIPRLAVTLAGVTLAAGALVLARATPRR